MRDYTAMTQRPTGGTEAVIVRASSEQDARAKLARKGYRLILWIL